MKICKARTSTVVIAGKSTNETVEISAKKRGNFALLQFLNGGYVCTQKLIGKATASNIQMSKTVQKFLNPNPEKPK